MNPQHRSYRIYLEDIESSMLKIFEYIGENSFFQFKQNSMLVDAVVRNSEIIGEAARNIPDEIMNKYPEIPWKKMYPKINLFLLVWNCRNNYYPSQL